MLCQASPVVPKAGRKYKDFWNLLKEAKYEVAKSSLRRWKKKLKCNASALVNQRKGNQNHFLMVRNSNYLLVL